MFPPQLSHIRSLVDVQLIFNLFSLFGFSFLAHVKSGIETIGIRMLSWGTVAVLLTESVSRTSIRNCCFLSVSAGE